MTTSWPVLASIAVLGLMVGSFLNVIAFRVPRGQSLAVPRTHCTHCAAPTRLVNNIPVLGWLITRGQCPRCKAPINRRYPLVELGTAALMVAITLRFGVTAQLPAYLFFASVAIVLALIDADQHQLPDTIVLPAYVIGTLLLMPAGAANGTWFDAARAAIGMAALWCIYAALQIACPTLVVPGYVKLSGLLGLFLGWLSWGALLVGVIIGFIVTVVAAKTFEVVGPKHRSGTLAYAPCMIAGAGGAVFAAAPVLGIYASMTGLA